MSVSDLQTIAGGIHEFKVLREESSIVKNLKNMPAGKSLFREHLLLSRNKAAAKAAAERAIPIDLNRKEQWIVNNLKNLEVEDYPLPDGAEIDEDELV